MVAHHRPVSPAAVNSPEEITVVSPIQGPQPTAAIKRRNKKKKKALDSDTASSASSNNCRSATSFSKKGIKVSRNPKRVRAGPFSMATTRTSVGPSEVDALGLPLGMSIAAFVAQVLERKNAAGENMSVDYLSGICTLAVRESLGNVFGDKFENFLTNFEKSFQSTLMTLRLISGSSENVDEQVQRSVFRRCSCSAAKSSLSRNELKIPACLSESTDDLASPPSRNIIQQHEEVVAGPRSSPDGMKNPAYPSIQSQTCLHADEITSTDFCTGRELILHDKKDEHRLTCSSNSDFNQFSIIEKSVIEQTRSNDLKTFEIGLIMKKMQLKEKQLELNSSSNLLERWKLSMGVSKALFKSEKFKTQLQDSREVELLKKCLDFLVAGLFIMLFSLCYGTFVYSRWRIIEITEACSPYTESKSSWWMPKSMSTFNSGLQLLKCQIQVLSRMLFGVLVIGAIALLLIQRSSASHQTMPVTFVLLLLGVVCGYAGKFCVDTLGGDGTHWLIYWEALCALHFFASTFPTSLYLILHGPITVVGEQAGPVFFAYWVRRLVFFTTLLFVPLLCGFMPFAGLWEWCAHFQSRAFDILTFDDVE